MTLLGLPAAQLLALFAGSGAVLALLYVLRQRRRRVEVPFVQLWQRVLRESESTALWQHIKRWLSLLFLLLILGLLVLSLGDPRLSASQKGRTLVLLIDASASMQAVDGPAPARGTDGTRLAEARAEARRVVRDLAGDDLAVVVALSSQPAPLGGLSQDERDLLSQVDAVTAQEGPADLPRALRLCGDLLQGRKNPQVVLISDGGFDDATLSALAPEKEGLDLRYLPVPRALPPPSAEPSGNVAITAFAVRRYRHNRTSYEVLLEVTSFMQPGTGRAADAPLPLQLELLQEGETVDVQQLMLVPGAQVQRLYPNLSGAGVHLEARIRLLRGRDVLPLDDHAYALLPERRHQRLLLVTAGNLFLEGALLSASAGDESQLSIDKVAPSAYDPVRANTYDVVLFDAFTPKVPPETSTLYLGPQGEGSPLPIAGTVSAPLFTDVARDHPLLRWVTLKDLNVSRASVFLLGPGDTAVASMLRQPIIAARERRGASGTLTRTVVIGFDLRRSDLPLRVAFPVLLVNALDWFAGDTGSETTSYATGHTWRIPLGKRGEAEQGEATITQPDGKSAPVPVHEGMALYHGQRVGFYQIDRRPGGKAPLLLAANLADATESAARVRPQLVIGPAPGHRVQPPEFGRSAVKRVLWLYLILGAVVLLFLEWWTYHRRWTV